MSAEDSLPPYGARFGALRSRHPIEVARSRVSAARSAWATATVAVSRRSPGAIEALPVALTELEQAFAAWDNALQEVGK